MTPLNTYKILYNELTLLSTQKNYHNKMTQFNTYNVLQNKVALLST